MVLASAAAVTMWCYGIGVTACVLPPELTARPSSVACPKVETWTKEDQKRVAQEMARLGGGSASLAAMGQYIRLRDQARAACSKK